MQSLHILRNLYFITSRAGQNSSSQYSFVNLVAIDILAQYPDLAENFLRTIKPIELGNIPDHPLERSLDLFFLNTAEHFALTLPPQTNEELVISAATPYLAAGGNNHLLEIFEAAHSVVLAVFSAPQNADVTAKHLPFYVDTLFTVSSYLTRLRLSSVTDECHTGIPAKPLRSSIPACIQICGANSSTTLAISQQPASPSTYLVGNCSRTCPSSIIHNPTTTHAVL